MWTDRFKPKTEKIDYKRIIWATPFLNILALNDYDKHLKPEASVVYKNLLTLGSKLLNYKRISHSTTSDTECKFMPWGKCSLCGNHGKHPKMVAFAKKNYRTICS